MSDTSTLRYLGEVTYDYTIGILPVLERQFNFVFAMIAFVCLPFVFVLLLGLIFWIVFIAVGYYIALAMVSPKTAEKIMKEAIIPYIKKKSD